MPFWGFVPEDMLGARYDVSSKKLILDAEGYVGNYSSGMSFNRLAVPNELLFQLGSWQLIGGPKLPYKHSQSFNIDLPSREFPSNQVTIETLSGFHTLQISNLPIVPNSTQDVEAKPNTTQKGAKLIKMAPDLEDLIVTHKQPFNISTTISLKSHSSSILDIFIKFDSNFFNLLTTSAQYNPSTKDTTLTYTFSSIQTGTSQILINRLLQTVPPHLSTTIHTIDIDLPNHPTFIPSSKLLKLLPSPYSPISSSPATFLDRVRTGYGIILQKFPKAMLLEVDACGVRAGEPVEGVRGFVVLRLVAAAGGGRDRRVVIGSTGWEDWEEVVVEEVVMWDLLPLSISPVSNVSQPNKANEHSTDNHSTRFAPVFDGEKKGESRDDLKQSKARNELLEGSRSCQNGCEKHGGFDGNHAPECLCLLSNSPLPAPFSPNPKPNTPISFSTPDKPSPNHRPELGPKPKRERTKTSAYNFTNNNSLPKSKGFAREKERELERKPQKQTTAKPFLDLSTALTILTSSTSSTTTAPVPISCNLRHPMYPNFTEPYYVFTLAKPVLGSLYIGIGASGGGVRVFGGGQGAVRRLSDMGEGTLAGGGEERGGSSVEGKEEIRRDFGTEGWEMGVV